VYKPFGVEVGDRGDCLMAPKETAIDVRQAMTSVVISNRTPRTVLQTDTGFIRPKVVNDVLMLTE